MTQTEDNFWKEWTEDDHAEAIESVFKHPTTGQRHLSMNRANLKQALIKFKLPNEALVSKKLFRYWLDKKYVLYSKYGDDDHMQHFERRLNPR